MKTAISIVGLLVALLVVVIIAIGLHSSPAADAWTTSEGFVRNSLKSPSSAKFSGVFETKAAMIGAGRWEVSGYVDSQNVFGAMIRNNWRTIIQKESDGKWRRVYMQLGTDEIGDKTTWNEGVLVPLSQAD